MEYFPSEELLLPLLMAGAVVLFLLYKYYNRYTGIKAVELLLREYYQEQGIELVSISKLKTADKLKYGVPINPLISFYSTPFQIFSALDETYCRMLETKDASGKEHMRYVEITFTGKKGMHVNEFDTFEF
ncbi:hypothetical protein OU798_10135 [Prolixibacteraceae bacterium Z1-6]|uniref:Uncharacterized protein n=1 Tax=Draconibacterium aestuarii TaxID=2998507 RepID=A0A9X3J5S3_9BACT|nr:hypothetical protein [Prolixibacteraceae bacterium Z1-6]